MRCVNSNTKITLLDVLNSGESAEIHMSGCIFLLRSQAGLESLKALNPCVTKKQGPRLNHYFHHHTTLVLLQWLLYLHHTISRATGSTTTPRVTESNNQ